MARKKIIAGNWKMNMTPSEAVKLVETLKPLVVNDEVDVVFCVPAIDIIPVVEAAKGSNIQVGAENMYFEEKGAYTGEIAPAMLVDAGVKYVVLGHSERREYFGETNEDVTQPTHLYGLWRWQREGLKKVYVHRFLMDVTHRLHPEEFVYCAKMKEIGVMRSV